MLPVPAKGLVCRRPTTVQELEINPLPARAECVVALDARIVLAD
jgi:hypothetical protein